MKKILILFLAAVLLQYACFAQAADEEKVAEIKNKITKINNEIERLQKRIETTQAPKKIFQLEDLINGHRARVKKLEAELAELEAQKIEEIFVTPEAEEIPEKEIKEEAQRFKFEIGGWFGIFGGSTSLSGELRFPLRFIFGPATTSVRLSGGYAQSKDASRRYIPVYMDGILNFPPGCFTGVENYLGAGLNYVVLTTGRTPGTIGGEIFYGVQSNGFGGKIFGEIGYGILRSGFSPSHKGVSVLVGYRREWGF